MQRQCCEWLRTMNLRHRYGFVLVLGLVLCLGLLGRYIVRPNEAELAPADTESVAAVAEKPETALPSGAPPEVAEATPAATPAPDVTASLGTFRGRVIDAVTRQPVREFELELHGSWRAGEEPPGAREFRTKDGRFEWQGIPPREWVVTATARGYQRFELNQLLISAEAPTAEIVLPLRRGHTLRGRVYDESSGRGIGSALITFRESHVGRYEGNFRTRMRTNSAEDGSFVLDGVPAGGIIFSVSAQTHVGREIDVVVSEQMPPLEIGLSAGGAISGQLVAADGATPAPGMLSLSHLDELHSYGHRMSETGEFSFERLPPGRYRLTARAETSGAERELSLAKNERKEGVLITLGSVGRTIRGVITGLRPADLERAQVRLQREGTFSDLERVGVDARGAYEIHGVEPGKVAVVAAVDMNRQIHKTVQVTPDADLTVDIEFPRGARLSGNVTRGGKPLSSIWLEPRSVEQRKLFIHGTGTSQQGEYVLEDVPHGQYYVIVGSYRSRSFEVAGDTVFDIDVPLAQFSGRTVEESGKVPVVGADVEIWPVPPQSTPRQLRDRSNHFGEFSFTGLEPGEYLLSAYKPGYEMHRERISYGSAIEGMMIRLRPGEGVQIRVRDARSGRPIQQVQANETIGDHHGSSLQVRLDENGVGRLPNALAGSTLTFYAGDYVPAVVRDWSGQELDLQLEKQAAP